MSTRTVIDAVGRVVIPKALRERLRLGPGDTLEFDVTGEELTLRPVRGTGPLRKKQGIWVFRGTGPLAHEDTDDVLASVREERDAVNFGPTR